MLISGSTPIILQANAQPLSIFLTMIFFLLRFELLFGFIAFLSANVGAAAINENSARTGRIFRITADLC